MIPDSLQEKIRLGDEDAFRLLYGEYSGEIYRSAKAALKNEVSSRETVKTVMIALYRAMCDAGTAIDTDKKVEELSASAIATALSATAPRHIPDGQTDEPGPVNDTRHVNADEKKGRSTVVTVITVIALILFFLLILWIAAGILMSFGFIPTVDLGYSFFDSRVFPLFLMH